LVAEINDFERWDNGIIWPQILGCPTVKYGQFATIWGYGASFNKPRKQATNLSVAKFIESGGPSLCVAIYIVAKYRNEKNAC
jgi:hypothetical protein